ncbi:MAG: hypothetical protein AAF366_02880 [Pseudomonadota bacterium]
MSFLPTLSPPATAPTAAARANLMAQTAVQPALRPAEGAPAKPGAVAETTAAKSQIPPVQPVIAVTGASAARPGHDGRATPETADDDKASADAREAEAARRAASEALQEALARIPVPVESIPKLSGDLEMIRSIGAPQTELDRRA